MNPTDPFLAFGNAFMPPTRCERFLLTIGSAKRLRKHDIIAHGLEDWFIELRCHDGPPSSFDIEAERDREVLVLDSERSGVVLELTLKEAMERIEDHGFGTLASIEPGVLAVYRGELMDGVIWLY